MEYYVYEFNGRDSVVPSAGNEYMALVIWMILNPIKYW